MDGAASSGSRTDSLSFCYPAVFPTLHLAEQEHPLETQNFVVELANTPGLYKEIASLGTPSAENGKKLVTKRQWLTMHMLELVRACNEIDIFGAKHGEKATKWEKLRQMLAKQDIHHSVKVLQNKVDDLLTYHSVSHFFILSFDNLHYLMLLLRIRTLQSRQSKK